MERELPLVPFPFPHPLLDREECGILDSGVCRKLHARRVRQRRRLEPGVRPGDCHALRPGALGEARRPVVDAPALLHHLLDLPRGVAVEQDLHPPRLARARQCRVEVPLEIQYLLR